MIEVTVILLMFGGSAVCAFLALKPYPFEKLTPRPPAKAGPWDVDKLHRRQRGRLQDERPNFPKGMQ